MDWGMMKNPTVAAVVLCNPTAPVYSGVPVSNTMVGRATSNSGSGLLLQVQQQQQQQQQQPSSSSQQPSSSTQSQPIPPAPLSSSKPPSPPPQQPTSCWYALLRNRLRFGVSLSVLILVTDAILRFSWTLRFYHKLFPSGDSFVLCTQFLEVFRRALWNLLRVEWENLKQAGHHLHATTTHSRHHHHHHHSPAPAAIQMVPAMGGGNQKNLVSKLHHHAKITTEKNAVA